ncbi:MULTISPECIES: BTAD domain-containing putative transcriptional regulator [unclassified Aeromicrobium]|uniref:BTAD domain-containing putative transcriptional regulator n=1 Tax=unclassified Aeromicrobium TaxID=2633570 RepID=UPI00396B0FF4
MTDPTLTPDASRFESLAPAPVEESSSVASRIGSALALVALLVGLPVALLLLGGAPPIPTELPALRDLARQLGPEDLVSVLVGIVWLLWLVFVVCVVLEIVATRRGGLARTVPFAGPLQHLARALIGGLLVTGLVAGPAANAAGPSESDIAPQTGAVAAAVVDAVTPAPEEKPAATDKVENRLEGELVYTVKAPKDGYHDNLWDIAERHLGDGFRYKEIYELNKDKVQLDGRKLELARLIQPGWQLVMPGDASGVDRVPVEQAPVTPPAGSQGGGGGGTSDAGGVEADSTAQAPESTAWWMGAGLLASGLLAALAVARRRRPGGEPDERARETEADLRLAADPERAAALDTVLRHLTDACERAGVDVPAAYAAVVGHDDVALHLAPAVPEAVEGWEAVEDGAVWRLTSDLSTLEAPEDAEPAYPSLVSLGVDTEGRDVLVDLASSGGLITVGGDLHVSAEVITSLVLQTAVSPWSRSVRVLATGLPSAVASVAERVTIVNDLESAASELEASRADDVLTGRRREDEVAILAVGSQSPGFALERLAGVAAAHPGTAAIAVGDHDAARWRLHVDEHGTLHVPQLGLAVTANRIGAHHAEAVASLFASAGLTTRPGDGDRVAIALPRRDADDAAWLTATSRVGILGSVVVDGPGEQTERRATVLTEIITFLALHPEGVHPTVLAGAVWPLGVTPEVRDANIERARVWLGSDREGHHRLRESLDGRLSLGPDVVCDWDAFRHLVIASRRAEFPRDEIDLLRRALKLVRGPAFEGAPRGRYAWAATLDLPRTIGELVIDAALRLATLLQDGRDPAGSAAAAGAILRIYPTHEEAWRIILRARHETGGASAVAVAVDQLETALAGEPMDHTTATLVDELLPHRGSQIS